MLTQELSSQIQFLHNQCPKGDEWSGLLIYNVEEGNVEQFIDPDNDKAYLELRAVAVFPMDYGTATFTSFEGNEDWLKMFEQFPQIDPINPTPGWYIGKIHSHNTMGVFHSGTDKSDLYENAPKLPMFLSLIVNYACEADCELAIAMEAEQTTLTRTVLGFKGFGKKTKKVEKATAAHKPVFLVKCDVVYEQETWLIEQAEALKTKKKPVWVTPTWDSHNKTWNNGANKELITSKVAPAIYRTAIDSLAELITLDTASDMAPGNAIKEVSIALMFSEVDDYKKALKYYFLEHWYDSSFMYSNATFIDSIDAVLEFLEHHRETWAYKYFKDAMNELKKEYFELWAVQRPSVV